MARSNASRRKNPPRKTRPTTSTPASPEPSHSPNAFADLPHDVKYYLVHEVPWSPTDLMALSQVNRTWREYATADTAWAHWFEVFPEDTTKRYPLCKNFSKREFVLLGLTTRCMGCGMRGGRVLVQTKQRICETCLELNPLYKCVDEGTRKLYDLELKDLEELPARSIVDIWDPETYGQVYTFVSERSLIDTAIQKHGGTLEAMNRHLAAVQLRADKDHKRNMALYCKARLTALKKGLPFTKSAPLHPLELTWGENTNNGIGSMWSSVIVGRLYYKDGVMHHTVHTVL